MSVSFVAHISAIALYELQRSGN